jgi:putative copper export protein
MLDALAIGLRFLTYAAALSGAGLVLAGLTLRLRAPVAVCIAGIVLVLTNGLSAGLLLERLGVTGDVHAATAVLATPSGLALAMHAAGGVLLALSNRPRMQFIAAVLVVAAFGGVGHAATLGLATRVSIIVHVAAAAWWLGGLLHLQQVGRTDGPERFESIVSLFSRQALLPVGALIVAALTTAALLLDFAPDVARTYDLGLLAKATLTAGLLALAALNRFILTPRLAASQTHRRWILRSIGAELALLTGVLAVTAWLTTTQSPHTAATQEQTPQLPIQGNHRMRISDAWAPALPAATGTRSTDMKLTNLQAVDDSLVAASSPWSEAVTLHRTSMDGQMTGMEYLEALPIAAAR